MFLFALLFWVAPTHAHDINLGQFDLIGFRPDVIEFVKERRAAETGTPNRPQRGVELELQRWVNEFVQIPANQPYFKNLEFKVWVESSSMPNATAAPNGEIKITQGLLDLFGFRQPQYVQAVIAHELAHVARAHAVRRISGTIGAKSVAEFSARTCTNFFSCKTLFAFFESQKMSRIFETEADHVALELMNNAKMDPALLAVALQALKEPTFPQAEVKRGPLRSFVRNGLKRAALACATHPETCDRVTSIFEEIKGHGYEHAWTKIPKPPAPTLKWLSEIAKRIKI